MVSHSTKRSCISVEEFEVDQQEQAEVETSPQRRWLCNELVRELCLEIPAVRTSEQILLTAHNMYVYLEPRFSKKRLIYEDAIIFLKAKLNAKNNIKIWINGVHQNKEENEEPYVMIKQEQSNGEFELETNHLRIRIQHDNERLLCPKVSYVFSVIYDDGQYENVHLQYFMRLIAPLLQPVHFDYFHYYLWPKPIEPLMRLLALTDCIVSIRLAAEQFNSAPIDEALRKCNKLEIYSRLSSLDMPKLIHWITNNNNNGRSKKCLSIRDHGISDSLAQLLDELEKDFTRAKSKRRFIIRLELHEPLTEFTLCNECTGEMLQLRRTGVNRNKHFYVLSRFTTNNGVVGNKDDEGKCVEFDTRGMTNILLH